MAEISISRADGTKERVPLKQERVTIGRSRESDVFLPDQWLSRHHAEILVREGAHVIADLGSKNGTLLNGERVQGERRLRHGDVITLGEHHITFHTEEDTHEEEERAPEGTRVFSVRELSDIAKAPAADQEGLARQNRLLRILSQAASSLLEHRPLPEVFEQILDLTFEAIPAERGAILLLEGNPPEPVVKVARSRVGPPITHVSRSIARKVIQDLSLVVLPNIMEDAAFKGQDSILSTGIRSALCAPLWYTSSTERVASRARPATDPKLPRRTTEALEVRGDSVIGLIYLDTLLRSHTFVDDDYRILTALATVAAAKIENMRLLEETIEKRRLEEDMRVAADIQRSLLPKAPPVVPGWGIVGSNWPCRTVGGDYYDFGFEGSDLLFALGDVSGKGTGAALLMTVLRAAVRGHWSDPDVSQATVRINRTVCQNIPEGKYITFFLGRLDPATGGLRFVNAGHNPPILVRKDGQVETLSTGGMVLGLLDDIPYDAGEASLAPGDTLLVFSDGVTETWNLRDEEFGEDRLAETALRGRGLDAAALQTQILSDLDVFGAGIKAADDRTLVVIKRY